jgi:hypothetical protein
MSIQYIPLNDVPKVVEKHFPFMRKPHRHTCWRWFSKGAHGRKLEGVIIAGKAYTTEEAVLDFLNGTQRRSGESSDPATEQREKQTRVRNASRKLSRFGA